MNQHSQKPSQNTSHFRPGLRRFGKLADNATVGALIVVALLILANPDFNRVAAQNYYNGYYTSTPTIVPPLLPKSGQTTITCASTPLYNTPAGSVVTDANGNALTVTRGQTFDITGAALLDGQGNLWIALIVGGPNGGYVPLNCTTLGNGTRTVGLYGSLTLGTTISWPDPNANGVVVIHANEGKFSTGGSALNVNPIDNGLVEARFMPNAAPQFATASTVTGNGTDTLTISGSGSSVNVTLANVVYQPNTNAVGVDQITIAANSPSPAYSTTIVIPALIVGNSASNSTAHSAPTATPIVTVLVNGPAKVSVPQSAVPNGTVSLNILAQNGTFTPSGSQIGNSQVIALGVIQAVDVFAQNSSGPVFQFFVPVKVCLQGTGRLYFLNATSSPRSLSQLSPSFEAGYSCASISSAGTVVLTN